MAIIRKKEIVRMNKEELEEKLKELRIELMRNNAQRSSHQNVAKTKEIKKTIARLLDALRGKQEKQKK